MNINLRKGLAMIKFEDIRVLLSQRLNSNKLSGKVDQQRPFPVTQPCVMKRQLKRNIKIFIIFCVQFFCS